MDKNITSKILINFLVLVFLLTGTGVIGQITLQEKIEEIYELVDTDPKRGTLKVRVVARIFLPTKLSSNRGQTGSLAQNRYVLTDIPGIWSDRSVIIKYRFDILLGFPRPNAARLGRSSDAE